MQPLRTGIWLCTIHFPLSLAIVGDLQIESGLEAWQVRLDHFPIYNDPNFDNFFQWLFIIFGIMTFLWGILMLFRLPDSPTNASFLTEDERTIATERLQANQTGYKNNHIDRGQMAEAFTDIKTWLLAI